jgi:protein ImuB
MPFGCIFVPDFPLEALLRSQPELRQKPVAVLDGKPPLETVVAANDQARRHGVSPGMTRVQLEGCPQLALRARSALEESAAHQALLDSARSFSPWVEDAAPDTILLDLSGLDAVFGPLPDIAHSMARRTRDLGFTLNVAVAHTLEAALVAARGFEGVTVIGEGKEAECLATLPVERLFADPSQEEYLFATFRRWGIRSLGELAALPELELSERLGQRGLALAEQARGHGHRLLVPTESPLSFEEAIEFDFPVVLLEPLAFALKQMLDQLLARLRARALAAEELRLELTLENASRPGPEPVIFKRTIRLPVPLLDGKVFLKLLELDLKANPPGAPVMATRLEIAPAPPRSAQNGFFDPSSPEPERLELTLAKISESIGQDRAGSPELIDTHRPQAFRMRRFAPSRGPAEVDPPPNDLLTALRIFRPPVRVKVHCQRGKPGALSSPKTDAIAGEVLWAAGPWRSSGEWWEDEGWARDEWDIALGEKTGIVLYRLVHDLVAGSWLVEGTYD